jgi:hypothetical protein
MGRALKEGSLRGLVFFATLFGGSMLGIGTSVAKAAVDYCPGPDYCYTAKDCISGCKNMQCTKTGGQCPDPGTQGTNCYTCTTEE